MTALNPSYSRGEVCVVDPGGDDRATISVDADHGPADDPDALDAVMRPVEDALLNLARLQQGEVVLDIGCGCGSTTLRAGNIVGPGGHVYGIDLTEPMLAVARKRLAASGQTNVEFVEADAQTQTWPGSFDAAVSRFGTMFFADAVAAFANIAQGLRRDGRISLASWQPLEFNDWLVIPGAALLRWIQLPDFSASGPGMFAQSDATTIEQVLTTAGFVDVEVEPTTVTLPFGSSAEEAVDRIADTGVGRAVLAAVPDPDRRAALDAVRGALAECADGDGVRINAGVLLTTARRP
jgi:SAM-dependent methyltransferase